MKETYDKIQAMKMGEENMVGRLSFTYLETKTTQVANIVQKGLLKGINKRFKKRNPFTLRIYRDED